MSVPDRKDILRIDCPPCKGNGYIKRPELVASDNPDGQTSCPKCGGVGMLEKEVDWRPEGYTLEEAGAEFGVENPTNKLLPGDPALDRGAGRVDPD